MSEAAQERQAEAAERTRRDLERLEKRPPSDGFWKALRVLGAVGWPIVICALLGALAGGLLGGPRWLTAAGIGLGAGIGFGVALSGIWRREP